MPHVSRHRLPRQIHLAISKQLAETLVKLVRRGRNEVFIRELLTRTERIMLAKRLAAIIMLSRGDSHYDIGLRLHLSLSSVARFHRNLENGWYEALLREFSKGKGEKILEALLDLFTLPPRADYKGWYRERAYRRSRGLD